MLSEGWVSAGRRGTRRWPEVHYFSIKPIIETWTNGHSGQLRSEHGASEEIRKKEREGIRR